MDYIAPFNMIVTSISGRSVELKKGEPTFCPPQMHAELISRGCMPAEEIPEAPVKEGSEPQVSAEREAALFVAFEAMALRNKRGDFSGTGVPHAAALAKELGWDVDGKERDAAWAKFQADKAL